MQTDEFSVFGFLHFDSLISVIFVVFDSGLVIKIRNFVLRFSDQKGPK